MTHAPAVRRRSGRTRRCSRRGARSCSPSESPGAAMTTTTSDGGRRAAPRTGRRAASEGPATRSPSTTWRRPRATRRRPRAPAWTRRPGPADRAPCPASARRPRRSPPPTARCGLLPAGGGDRRAAPAGPDGGDRPRRLRGMVFVWDEDTEGGFWMRNTPTPLSIAWFDADGDFVSSADMEPCRRGARLPDLPAGGPVPVRARGAPGRPRASRRRPRQPARLGGGCAAAS